ncbi:MAG: NfeD family protein [Dongiaceae bacterium]
MTGLLENLQFWHWWVLGVALLALEVAAPGTFFLWLAIAAGVTGVAALAFPAMGWPLELVMFAVLAVASVLGGRAFVKRHPIQSDDNTLNRRGEQHVGRIYALAEAIRNGRGTLKVGDSVWRVEGPDLPAGARVRVTAISGAVLTVEPAE